MRILRTQISVHAVSIKIVNSLLVSIEYFLDID